jgi:hypothetical protein
MSVSQVIEVALARDHERIIPPRRASVEARLSTGHAHTDLVAIHPVFNLYNYEWPI